MVGGLSAQCRKKDVIQPIVANLKHVFCGHFAQIAINRLNLHPNDKTRKLIGGRANVPKPRIVTKKRLLDLVLKFCDGGVVSEIQMRDGADEMKCFFHDIQSFFSFVIAVITCGDHRHDTLYTHPRRRAQWVTFVQEVLV